MTTRKDRKPAQEDSCAITVEVSECLQQEKVEAEQLQKSRDDLAEKQRRSIAAQKAAAEWKKAEKAEQ